MRSSVVALGCFFLFAVWWRLKLVVKFVNLDEENWKTEKI